MCGAIPLLPLYAFIAWTGATLTFFIVPSQAVVYVPLVMRGIYLETMNILFSTIYSCNIHVFSILVTVQYQRRKLLRCSDTGVVGCNTGSSERGCLSSFFDSAVRWQMP